MDGVSQLNLQDSPEATAAVVKWTTTAQQIRQLLASSAVLKQLGILNSLCSTIQSLPAAAVFPVHQQHKQQQAFDLLLVLLPQLLCKLLGQRPKQWLSSEQICSNVRSLLQATHHMCVSAGIDHTANADTMPMIRTLGQQWLGFPLLETLASAMQDMAQLLSQHQSQHQQSSGQSSVHSSTPSHLLMALAYELVYVWLAVDTVIVANRYTLSATSAAAAQISAAAQAAAAVVLAAARVMPLDTPPLCHSMLLDVSLRLLYHPSWGDPSKALPTSPAADRFMQSPDILGLILLLLTLQAAVLAERASTINSRATPLDASTAAAHSGEPGPVTEQQVRVQELQLQLEALWQQLGIRPELLPSFLAAVQSKYHLEYTGYIMGLPERIGLTGPTEAYSLAAGLLLRLLTTSSALRTLGPADKAICSEASRQERSPKVSAAGKQQQQLLGSVALQLPGVLLSTAALSDPCNNALQFASITPAELLLCCWQELSAKRAGALNTGAASCSMDANTSSSSIAFVFGSSSKNGSKGIDSSSRDSRTNVGSSSSSNSSGTTSSSKGVGCSNNSSSALHWPPGEVQLAVDTVLQCWCRLMQQQLQLASQSICMQDAAPSDIDNVTPTLDQGVGFVTKRLNTITCLLPVLADVSMASASLLVDTPLAWHSHGCKVLQLLEQYVRTVLAHLHCDPETTAGAHSQEHSQWQQQQQAGAGARPDGTYDIQVGMHADIITRLCPCCRNKTATLAAFRHRQLVEVMSQLLLGNKQFLSDSTLAIGPLLHASCVPGALQQQLLSLLTSVQKRLHGCYAFDKYALINEQGVIVRILQKGLGGPEAPMESEVEESAVYAQLHRARASAAAQLVVLLGRTLLHFGTKLQQLLQQAAAAVEAIGCNSEWRRTASSSRASKSMRQSEAAIVLSLQQLSACCLTVSRTLQDAQDACVTYTLLGKEAQELRRSLAAAQLVQLHNEAQELPDGSGHSAHGQQQQDTQHMADQQQQEQGSMAQAYQRLQQKQGGRAPNSQQLQLPPHFLLLDGNCLEGPEHSSSTAYVAQEVAMAAYLAAERAAGSATNGMTFMRAPGYEQQSELLSRPSPAEKQQLAAACSASECMAVLLACDEVQQLPGQLLPVGEFMCAAAPMTSWCSNPRCTNLSGASEMQLVQGWAAKCGACRTARYCSKACQAAHWKSAHKRVCNSFAAQLAAAASVQGLVQEALRAHGAARGRATAAADAAEQYVHAAAGPAEKQDLGEKGCTEQDLGEEGCTGQQQQQRHVPAALIGAVNAVYAAERLLTNAAWVTLPVDSTPSAQELMAAAVAAHELSNTVLSVCQMVADSSTKSGVPDGWQQGVVDPLEEACWGEVAAAGSLALAYHALIASVT